MISLKNILFAVTKAVAENFTQDVYIQDNNTQGFDKSCFFVQILPIQSIAITKYSNLRNLSISIKYLQQPGEDILTLYDVGDKLEEIFGRTLYVEDTYLTTNDFDTSIYSDEVGRILDFMIHLQFDDIKYNKYDGPNHEGEEYDLMRELHLQFEELRKITIIAEDEALPLIDKAKVSKTKINQ